MKVSRNWLQNFFESPLPSGEVIDNELTFHSFEIEEHVGDMIDVNVLPNRAADCLSHRGIAKEISAILDVPFSHDPLQQELPKWGKSNALTVDIEDTQKCSRYIGAYVKGVKIGPSPLWLKEALEAVGQRSINNVVDATNYVMLNIGQPLHAFDADKLAKKDGVHHVRVRTAHDGEEITTLTGEKYSLPKHALLITDAVADVPIGIAGIKGGNVAQIDETTTSLVVEAANFYGPSIRRTAQKLNLVTDASLRFQNNPSVQLVAYGMRDVLELIVKTAGGVIEGVTDVYEARPEGAPVSISLEHIRDVLGIALSHDTVSNIFKRLDLSAEVRGDTFIVTPPFERTDITIPEDLIEEVGRIAGYDILPDEPLPEIAIQMDNERYHGVERIKDFLVERGFTEISTQSFSKKGDIALANPFNKTKPMLRTTLMENMEDALIHAKQYAPRVFGPNAIIKLFEIGTIFTKNEERVSLALSEKLPELDVLFEHHVNPLQKGSIVEYSLSTDMLISIGKEYTPKQYENSGMYKPFSSYPFVLRDIAVWTPEGTTSTTIEEIIRLHAGELLVRADQFDSFTKDTRTSFAFRLVFESPERTLTDELVNTYMEKITVALNGESGYEVR
ncbi:MAG TPA: phenylalanine--tRNA ligase subunit beta [Candidatus Kaiserbacteria bacterium]|nr:phenylalanine--tRNA ligase subunit beta [Candidatus Kaiserbacteria bacterium]